MRRKRLHVIAFLLLGLGFVGRVVLVWDGLVREVGHELVESGARLLLAFALK